MTLFPTAKLQNLKAIHNVAAVLAVVELVVSNRKITKSESNSQHGSLRLSNNCGCFQPQNYKI